MGFKSWVYSNSKGRKKVVKIVHPGGHAELHDRPITAADIIRRNPRCFVAHPNVFHQPWAIVPPETTLMPGQKFYVVPITTIRKLQKLSLKYQPEPVHRNISKTIQEDDHAVNDDHSKVNNTTNYVCFPCMIKENDEAACRSFGFSNKEAKSRRSLAASLDNWEPNLQRINE